ncbi:MAG: daptide biosynthesis intramembrane metalloprotease, partial [Dermatophilaceae bacterium]
PWSEAAVAQGVAALDRAGLLDRVLVPIGRGAHRRRGRHRKPRARRFTFLPPLTFQVAILRSGDRLAGAFERALGWAFSAVAAVLLTLAVVGSAATAWQGEAVYAALGSALSPAVLLLVAASLSMTTVVHELAHAWTLKHNGGRPGRMGVMLFYLAPAFFCDVSDAWRLPHRSQRVKVALAGIITQMGLGGAASLAALRVNDPDLKQFLLLYAAGNLFAGLLNALPFVKLDGYIALMSHLDHPNLRSQSMATVRAAAVRFFAQATPTGQQTPSQRAPTPLWQQVFGVGCLAVPVLLVARALDNIVQSLASLGVVGKALVWLLLLVLTWLMGRAARRVVTEIRAGGPRWGRIAGTLAAVAVALTGLGAATVTTTDTAGYVVRENGMVELVVADGQPQPALRPGEPVELQTGGLLLQNVTGHGAVTDTTPRGASAPLTAFTSVRLDGIPVPVQAYHLDVATRPSAPVGLARFDPRPIPLRDLVIQRLLAPTRSAP